MTNHTRPGIRERIPLSAARSRLRAVIEPHRRTERVPIVAADGRALAGPVVAERDVPHYPRAAMDGFAVRAQDTFGASDRSPAVLRRTDGEVGPGEAARVHTGSELPRGADAVVMVESVEVLGREIEALAAVPEGENVAPVGEDVEDGTAFFEAGHRLRPSDLGLVKSVGHAAVEVYERPTVGVIPTGDELVQTDPAPGQTVETNGLTVARYVERWGGEAAYREVVPDDEAALREAIERDATRDLVVTTGGSSVGERDLVPDVVDELGEVLVHGVALAPGHPVALGVVDATPVLMLPGYPVSCIVNAVQFLRPALAERGGWRLEEPPTVTARLDGKIASEPGVRTFAPVRLDAGEDGAVASPIRAAGAGVLSAVARADGWVVVPEAREGIPDGERVAVERWEGSP